MTERSLEDWAGLIKYIPQPCPLDDYYTGPGLKYVYEEAEAQIDRQLELSGLPPWLGKNKDGKPVSAIADLTDEELDDQIFKLKPEDNSKRAKDLRAERDRREKAEEEKEKASE